ncbi:haloacid dehalogenase-like hydrolase [Candidatus Woesearchaeota archaeon]|nr:haloacid dehalogenase-like hydrolase [Candidatus Woesearchaeota archaeon]
MWDGKPSKPYYDLVAQHEYVAGARETFAQIKQAGIPTAIITSGPYDLAVRAQHEVGIDYIYANRLLIQGDRIVGTTDMSLWPVLSDEKVKPLDDLCRRLNLKPQDIIAVLHDTNDVKLARYLRDNGGKVIGFMYEPHEELEKYCNFITRQKDLKTVLPFLLAS